MSFQAKRGRIMLHKVFLKLLFGSLEFFFYLIKTSALIKTKFKNFVIENKLNI